MAKKKEIYHAKPLTDRQKQVRVCDHPRESNGGSRRQRLFDGKEKLYYTLIEGCVWFHHTNGSAVGMGIYGRKFTLPIFRFSTF
jgi:hypothetical protein